MTNRDQFTLGGMFAGAAAGVAAAGGVNGKEAGVAMLAGATIGAILGFVIGTRLDEAEKAKAEAAALSAANNGSRIYWSSDRRAGEISGYAEPMVKVSASGKSDQVSQVERTTWLEPAPSTNSNNLSKNQNIDVAQAQCRSVREVFNIRGQESSSEVQYCNDGSGWRRAK